MIPSLDNKETPPPPMKSGKSVDIPEYYGLDYASFLYSDSAVPDELSALHEWRAYTQHLAQALVDCSIYNGISEMGAKMMDCGTHIAFDEAGKISGADFCRLRFCPMCQKRRSLKMYGKFSEILEKLQDKSFLHLVLTCPNCTAERLAETIDNLYKASSALFKLEPCKKAFLGIARVLEVTHNPDRAAEPFHPHLHCLVCVNNSYFTSRVYLKREKIQRLWTALCNIYEQGYKSKKPPSLATTELKAETLEAANLYQIHITKADKGALPEIAKYTMKPFSFDIGYTETVRLLEQLYPALHNRRAIQLYGNIRAAAKSDSLDDDDEAFTENGKSRMYLWKYDSNSRLFRYEKV